MLEGILTSVISRIAGKYVDGIDKKAAGLSVWKGEIRLKNLSLKPSAIDDMDLPVRLVHGSLKELQLDIPWKNLRSKPVVVKITGLCMVVCPNNEPSMSAEQHAERALASKRAAIAELDAAGLAGNDEENESWSSRLVTKICDNIQLEVCNVHVRYEDQLVHADAPFSFGLMIGRLAAESTDTNWKPAFVEKQKVLFKLCSLQGLSFYLNSDQHPPFSKETASSAEVQTGMAHVTVTLCGARHLPNVDGMWGSSEAFVELIFKDKPHSLKKP